ncbi:putative glucosylceramidase 4 [Tribolium madens]|uniref:putative glucosylceramidase 4 n=1 Tax=Tribolium madens TaxID=41895 RepID=UPI001CF7461D|nr:putative glucosylceramidase 4 [Tribolium madens]
MWIIILFVLVTQGTTLGEECRKRDYGNGGHVCVCTSKHCDTVSYPERVEQPEFLIYTSNKAGLRFHKSSGTFTKTSQVFDNQILINANEKYQTLLGWGGAFTDATGINIDSLDEDAQTKLLETYFSEDGIEYSLCRVPIGGTDFSERGYSYADGRTDEKLAHFRLAPEDFQYKIPFIKKAQDISKGKLQLFASAWTAPKWMKTNGEYAGFGFLKDNMFQAWANYFIKFLENYKSQGIQFWGLTTGNEPSLGITPFSKINSVGWTPVMMSHWIRNNLGPTIRNSSFADIKLITLDDQRFFLPWFTNIVFRNKATKNYIDGIAVHWYYDSVFPASLLKQTHDNFPEKFLLATEACRGEKLSEKDVSLGSWERGESYAFDIIEDVTNWVSGWVDWNMALDLKGGPTYIKNYVDSPIIVNSTAGEFYKQPMFYSLGHFSKFVPKESIRIGSTGFDDHIPVAAFQRPDHCIVVVILNKKDHVVPVTLVDDSKGSVQIELSKKSITTVLYW